MQYFLFSLLLLAFLWLNYKIIKSDIKEKKIPNKYLWYLFLLLPFFYSFLYFSGIHINIINFILQIFLSLIISFTLYYFWIWSAWDAKYLLVLSLFIPHIWIIPFVWNIALITILYLFWYFLWFYFWRCLFNWKYTKSLYLNIYNDLKDKWRVKKNNSNTHDFFIILKWLLVFLIIFVSIRLFRIYLFNDIFLYNSNWWLNKIDLIKEIIEKYHIYLVLLFIWLFLAILLRIKWIKNKIKAFLNNKIFIKYQLNPEFIDNIFIIILFFILISFIIFEYLKNPYKIENYLIKIFTMYLVIWWFFKILLYMYKVSFSIAETYYIDIKDLKEWDVIDKDYLIKMFWEQYCLKTSLHNSKPSEYFQKIENPIDKENLKKLKNIFEIVNSYHLKNTNWYIKNYKIKILYSFAFAPYIILWLIISFLFWNEIFKYIITITQKIIKNIYNY